MSSSTSQTPGPAAKRRRVDAANATLRKPFRSPMIRRPSESTPGQEATPSAPRPGPAPGATPARPTSSALFTTPTPATPTPAPPTGLPTRRLLTKTPLSRPPRPGTNTTTDASPTKTNPPQEAPEDPAVQEQAQKITRQTPPGQPVDAELKAATAKWRAAGRAAAEDLFELVKGRVERMGAEERRGRSGCGDDFGREEGPKGRGGEEGEGEGGRRLEEEREGGEGEGRFEEDRGGEDCGGGEREGGVGGGSQEEGRGDGEVRLFCLGVLGAVGLLTDLGVYDVGDAEEPEYRAGVAGV